MIDRSLAFFRSPGLLAIAGFSFALLSPAILQGGLILGSFNTSANGQNNVSISLDRIDFGTAPSTTGPFTINSASGGFASLAGSGGQIANIDNPPYTVGTFFPTIDFLTFSAAPNISFTLQVLLPGVEPASQCNAAPAAGQNCTPIVPNMAPYNLTNTSAVTSTASFDVIGVEVDSLTNTSVPFIGVIGAQFNTPYQTLLTEVAGGQTVVTSYSATFSTVPEPGTKLSFLLGVGLLGIAYAVRRAHEARMNR
jgi:hypothetical protein